MRMKKTILYEFLYLFIAIIIALISISLFCRIEKNNDISINLFHGYTTMSIKLMFYHFWLLSIFIITLLRQLKLKFNKVIPNLLLTIVCVILIYFFNKHIEISENLKLSFEKDAKDIISEVNITIWFFRILQIMFAIVSMICITKLIQNRKKHYA